MKGKDGSGVKRREEEEGIPRERINFHMIPGIPLRQNIHCQWVRGLVIL